jgi:hypothetical protein
MFKLWEEHGTKLLGAAAFLHSLLSLWLTIDGLIPSPAVKWVLAINGALGLATMQRGFTNTARQQPPSA